jgi:hypothetical protein
MTIQKRWWAIALLVLIPVVQSIRPSAQSKSSSSGDDKVITLDGSKNPEQIPQWLAWQEAFRVMGMPAQLDLPIPTTIWEVTTAAERDLIRKEAMQSLEREDEVGAQVMKIREAVTEESRARDEARAKQLDLRRRQAILDSRERVLARLSPEGQIALRAFAEEVKKGIKVTILKSLLAEYSMPE